STPRPSVTLPDLRRVFPRGIVVPVLLAFWLVPAAANAETRYFAIIFGSQSVPLRPKYTHTWATVVKVSDDAGGCAVESHTISWMPATLNIRVWSFRPEPGVNLDLHTTLRLMRCNGERLSMWGPYEIDDLRYYRFLQQKARMESGIVR